jgi:hypothetical protein
LRVTKTLAVEYKESLSPKEIVTSELIKSIYEELDSDGHTIPKTDEVMTNASGNISINKFTLKNISTNKFALNCSPQHWKHFHGNSPQNYFSHNFFRNVFLIFVGLIKKMGGFGSATYGEIAVRSVPTLCHLLDISKQDIFYDLGCGV